jgi:hypothetical protein
MRRSTTQTLTLLSNIDSNAREEKRARVGAPARHKKVAQIERRGFSIGAYGQHPVADSVVSKFALRTIDLGHATFDEA